MNNKIMTTKIKTANTRHSPRDQRKESRGVVTYMIASLIALWLAEAFFGRPYTFREIEI